MSGIAYVVIDTAQKEGNGIFARSLFAEYFIAQARVGSIWRGAKKKEFCGLPLRLDNAVSVSCISASGSIDDNFVF